MKPFLTFHFHFLLFLSFLLSPFQRSSSSSSFLPFCCIASPYVCCPLLLLIWHHHDRHVIIIATAALRFSFSSFFTHCSSSAAADAYLRLIGNRHTCWWRDVRRASFTAVCARLSVCLSVCRRRVEWLRMGPKRYDCL